MSLTPAETFHLARLEELIDETSDALEQYPAIDSPEAVELSEAAWANLGRLVHKLGRRSETLRQLGPLLSSAGAETCAQVEFALVLFHHLAGEMQAERDAYRDLAA